MKASTIIAGRLLLAACSISSAAFAGEAPTTATSQWSHSGDGNIDVMWSGPVNRSQHGGSTARLVGDGDNATILYADTPVLQQATAIANMSGTGDNASISYAVPGSGRQILMGATVDPRRRG
jgi:hypothetical protein